MLDHRRHRGGADLDARQRTMHPQTHILRWRHQPTHNLLAGHRPPHQLRSQLRPIVEARRQTGRRRLRRAGKPHLGRHLPNLRLADPYRRQRRDDAQLGQRRQPRTIRPVVVRVRAIQQRPHSTTTNLLHKRPENVKLAPVAPVRRIHTHLRQRQRITRELAQLHAQPRRHLTHMAHLGRTQKRRPHRQRHQRKRLLVAQPAQHRQQQRAVHTARKRQRQPPRRTLTQKLPQVSQTAHLTSPPRQHDARPHRPSQIRRHSPAPPASRSHTPDSTAPARQTNSASPPPRPEADEPSVAHAP